MIEEEVRLRGVPVSEGIAEGVAFFLIPGDEESIPDFPITLHEVDEEIGRYRRALYSSREDLEQLRSSLTQEGLIEAAGIIEAHILMLQDPLITSHVEERIRAMCKNTEAVFHAVVQEFEMKFCATGDPLFAQRIVDVQDLYKRILGHLKSKAATPSQVPPPNSIVFSKEISPTHTAAVQPPEITAFVTQLGGGNSHAALIARAKGIPFVSNIEVSQFEHWHFKQVIVDGSNGEVIFNPSQTTVNFYRTKQEQVASQYQHLREEKFAVETWDGFPVRLLANVGSLADIENIRERGAEGIGLFRSEYFFLSQAPFFPTEEEQLALYRLLLQKTTGMPVVIRVFDVGGDKNIEQCIAQGMPSHEVPHFRGMRFLLRFEEIFKTQLRAILRASWEGDVHILLPLVSHIDELRRAQEIIVEIRKELGIVKNIPVGCMIEVPSAALLGDHFAREADFLSVGTNDLTQYTFGIDRSHGALDAYGVPWAVHPSMVRMLKLLVLEAKKRHIDLSICGEIASNPIYIPLLLGLGIRIFSCAPRYLPAIKHAIRSISLLKAYECAEEALQQATAVEIADLLVKYSHK